MSKVASRKVHGFSENLRKTLLGFGENRTVCPCCKSEMTHDVDHIVPLQWLRHIAALGLKCLNGMENAGVLCKKCHSVKSKAENKIDVHDLDAIMAHVAKWRGYHFTPKGTRRKLTLQKPTAKTKRNIGGLQAIQKCEMEIRITKRKLENATGSQAEFFGKKLDRLYKRRAAWRRKAA